MSKNIELRAASLENLDAVFDMYQEFDANDTGFTNLAIDISRSEFDEFVQKLIDNSQGKYLPEGYVPMTTFWLYVDGHPVGISKLRHELNDHLRKVGGHIGYGVRKSERGKGYGTTILELTLLEAKKINIHEVLLTTDPGNVRSQKVIERNGGVIENKTDNKWYYWITQK